MKIEIRTLYNEECDQDINALFVDDKMFDYLIDEDSLRSAAIYCNKNPHLQKAVHGDILKHFVNSFCEFVGQKYTLEEIYNGIRNGALDG